MNEGLSSRIRGSGIERMASCRRRQMASSRRWFAERSGHEREHAVAEGDDRVASVPPIPM